MSTPPALAAVEEACAAQGLHIIAGFHPAPGEAIGATLLLLGNAGPAMWQAFAASPECSESNNPLDRWSRRIIDGLATEFSATPLYPFGGPPHHPFQRWALNSGQFSVSPLGVLVHPHYGPWFAFRGALAFDRQIELPSAPSADPCGDCRDKPCLNACPVGAVTLQHYDVAACRGHVSHRNNDCYNAGCLARHACPLGREFIYAQAQACFHMEAFIA